MYTSLVTELHIPHHLTQHSECSSQKSRIIFFLTSIINYSDCQLTSGGEEGSWNERVSLAPLSVPSVIVVSTEEVVDCLVDIQVLKTMTPEWTLGEWEWDSLFAGALV